MRNHRISTASRGQSIVEVVIVTVFVATILTAIASIVTNSLKRTADSKQKNTATDLAQEGIETFRQYRQRLGWQTFQPSLTNAAYCLNTLPSTEAEFYAMTTGGCDTGEVITGTNFTREALVTSSPTEVTVTVTVSWDDGSPMSVSVNQSFKDISENGS